MPEIGQDGPRRQDRIVQATIALLLDVGLRAATTRAVTDKAGVGTGLLNHYFRWPDLRARAWGYIFAAVAVDQFPPDQDPQTALDHYFATAFTPDARRYWHLWTEGAELAASDEAMRVAVETARSQLRRGLVDVLNAGCLSMRWHLPDPQATAFRLGALYDGLAGLLLVPDSDLTEAQAEAHLRMAFALEARLPT